MAQRQFLTGKAIAERINYNDPYCYNKKVTLSGPTDTEEATIQIGTHDFFVTDIVAMIKDASGNKLDLKTNTDTFTVQIKTEDGEDFFQEPVPLEMLVELINSNRFKGWVLEHRQELQVSITGAGIPTSAVKDDTHTVYLALFGYRMVKPFNQKV